MIFKKRCTKCLIPADFPGISFNSDGLCSYCLGQQHYGISGDERVRKMLSEKDKLKGDFENRLEEFRGRGQYDCLVPLSGGKDSCYLLYLLKNRYNLRILAYTLDNGLLSPVAKGNIKHITDRLEIDHIFAAPQIGFFRRLYRYLILCTEKNELKQKGYSHTVCSVCNKTVILGFALKEAANRDIPLVIGGLGPDQIRKYFYEVPNEEIQRSWVPPWLDSQFFVDEDRRYFWDPGVDAKRGFLPQVMFPFHVMDYPGPDKIAGEIVRLGLVKKNRISPRVTNCHLTWLLQFLDMKKGFHPMVAILSYEIRIGRISRTKPLILLELSNLLAKTGIYRNFIRSRQINSALKFLDLKIRELI